MVASKTGAVDADEANDYTLRIKLTDAQSAVDVRVDIEDSRGTRTVYKETHDPDDSFVVDATGHGPDATFRIYYDDDLKKTIHQNAHRTGSGAQGATQ